MMRSQPYGRLRTSKLAWAPELPEHWRESTIGRVATVYAGGTPDRGNRAYWEGGTIPWLNSGSVNDWVVTEPSELITPLALAGSSTRWVPPHSVVVALAGQGRTKGMAARVELRTTLNQSMAAVVPSSAVEYRFVQYWLTANYASIRNLAGGDLRDGLNLQHVKSVGIPLPPITEQEAIADLLDRETAETDAFIRDQGELIRLLSERRAATIAHAVTKGLDADAPMVDSGIDWLGAVPAGWEIRPLWSMFDKVKDVGHPDEMMLSVFRDLGVVAKDAHQNLNQTAENRNIYQLIGPGWLAANRMKAWQGSVGISTLRGIVSGHYICFRPKHAESSAYLNYLFRSPTYVIGYARLSRGVRIGQAEIDNDQYRLLPVLLPPRDVQAPIVNYLDRETKEIDAAIADAKELIALLQERRAAVISAAVTGKIDVRERMNEV